MRLQLSPIAAVLLLATLAHPASAGHANTTEQGFTRADLANYRGAVLIVNAVQTSCEVALIDGSSGFVAANCLDFSGGQLNTESLHKVYTDKNNLDAATAYPIESIHIHPAFNLTTLANNIALVEFNTKRPDDWKSPIAVDRRSWTDLVYVQRSLHNVKKMTWNPPTIQEHKIQVEAGCRNSSNLFNANPNDYLCGSWTAKQPFNKTCAIPFSSVYGQSGNDMGIAALFSHSVIYGNNACTSKPQFSYFLVLANYIGWADNILGRDVSVLPKNATQSLNKNVDYKMKDAQPTTIASATVAGGDFYSREGIYQKPAFTTGNHKSTSTTAHSSATSKSSPEPTSSTTTATIGQPAISSSTKTPSSGRGRGDLALGWPVSMAALLVALSVN
ncbi:hypothetical protein GQ54DRAFT_300671 [Martensiomyces pterosporus]|nr:hypothetical protein GQ54DRAFT_300671 [Martensiomyces pterosporus]